MKPIIWKILKFINVAGGFCLALWILSQGFGIFALILAIYITYLNAVIDDIYKRSNQEGC